MDLKLRCHYRRIPAFTPISAYPRPRAPSTNVVNHILIPIHTLINNQTHIQDVLQNRRSNHQGRSTPAKSIGESHGQEADNCRTSTCKSTFDNSTRPQPPVHMHGSRTRLGHPILVVAISAPDVGAQKNRKCERDEKPSKGGRYRGIG